MAPNYTDTAGLRRHESSDSTATIRTTSGTFFRAWSFSGKLLFIITALTTFISLLLYILVEVFQARQDRSSFYLPLQGQSMILQIVLLLTTGLAIAATDAIVWIFAIVGSAYVFICSVLEVTQRAIDFPEPSRRWQGYPLPIPPSSRSVIRMLLVISILSLIQLVTASFIAFLVQNQRRNSNSPKHVSAVRCLSVLRAVSTASIAYWMIVKGARSPRLLFPGDGQVLHAIFGATLMFIVLLDWIPLWIAIKRVSRGGYITSMVLQPLTFALLVSFVIIEGFLIFSSYLTEIYSPVPIDHAGQLTWKLYFETIVAVLSAFASIIETPYAWKQLRSQAPAMRMGDV